MANFVEKYISDCIDNGICSFTDIASKAKSRVIEIDQEIDKLAELRKEKTNLLDVLRQVDPQSSSKRKPGNQIAVDSNSQLEFDSIAIEVCDIIESNGGPILPTRLIERAGFTNADPSPLYTSIKDLCNNKVIQRNETNRTLERGPNWDNRPRKV